MKKLTLKSLLMTLATLLPASAVYGHSSGEHSGGFMQQLMHILQSADHLFIILAMGVAISVLIRHVIKNRD